MLFDNNILESLHEIGTALNKPNYVKQFFELFAQECEQSMIELEASLKEKNFKKIASIAHKIKGSAQSAGALELALNCQKFEDASNKADHNSLLSLQEDFIELQSILKKTNSALKSSHLN